MNSKQQQQGSREALRKRLRQQRRRLSSQQQQEAARSLAGVARSLKVFQYGTHVAVYLANDGEIDPSELVQWLWLTSRQCYLPIVPTNDSRLMYFQRYHPDTKLAANKYGINEPVFNPSLCISSEQLDLVLMPLTGFDEQGGRMGMGGGYYDRTFSFLKEGGKPALIGLAHECQKVAHIPAEQWDITMTGVVTDRCYYPCSQEKQ